MDALLEQEFASQFHPNAMSRRRFIVTSLTAGFACAAMPVSAQTITTDEEGLVAGEVEILVADGKIPAYRAQPAQSSDLPVIVVVQEIFGVHEHIRDVCRRLAKRGYLAIAAELYARQGDPAKIASVPELISTIVSKVPDAQVMSDLDATVAWAKAHGGGSKKLAVTGFCWGGRITWLYAAHNPEVKAAVAWYGPLVGTPTTTTPQFPVDIAATLKAPVLGLYGGLDRGITAEHVESMRMALKHAPPTAADSEIIVYPDAPHGFHADYRPSYVKHDAEEAWQRMLDWFGRYGVV